MIDDSRFEIKYVISAHELTTLISWLVNNDAHFYQPFPARIINNIYFDLPDLNDASDNLIGISQRKKLRLRWYDQQDTANAVIEYKIKRNRLGIKKQYALPPINFKTQSVESIYKLVKSLKDIPADIRMDPRWHNPTLHNTYKREYYISADQKVRVTIDSDIRYYIPRKFQPIKNNSRPYTYNGYIVEFKTDYKHKPDLEQTINQFPYQPQRHSKYLSGISRFYDVPYF